MNSRFQVFSSKDRDTTAILLIPKLKQDCKGFQLNIQINLMQVCAEIKAYLGCILGCFWVSAARDM